MPAKKHFGQHFLKEAHVAERIAAALKCIPEAGTILEIGPGRGALTRPLLKRAGAKLHLLEIDADMKGVLEHMEGLSAEHIHWGNALELNWEQIFGSPLVVSGNFPYNISSQLVWKAIEHRQQVLELVGMFQREVAQRLAARPGSRIYGHLSVVAQAFFEAEYLFGLAPGHFNPPPAVHSAVIRLRRRPEPQLPCSEKDFLELVKRAFGQRRKTLRNSLKPFVHPMQERLTESDHRLLGRRPEQLGVTDFIYLTRLLTGQE